MKNQQAFLAGYRHLRIPVVDENGAPEWKEKFPTERIDELRAAAGARHFASQMMLDPAPIERARLDAGALHFYDAEPDMQSARLGGALLTGCALYWDPSMARKRGDASVCAFLLRDDRARRAFIHDCLYLQAGDGDRHPLATQCAAVLDFMESRGLENIAVEINGIGNALPEILRREAAERQRAISVRSVANHENKGQRILDAIEPLLGTGRLHAHERVRATGLLGEMEDWTPNGWARDDGLDAVAGALRMAPVPLRPRGKTIVPVCAMTDFSV
jgi:hypothetical protein